MNPTDPAFPKGCAPRFTSRAYAAIHLRVPDSGEAWLDKMILESLRDELAGKAMPMAEKWINPLYAFKKDSGFGDIAEMAHQLVDAMLEQRGKKK